VPELSAEARDVYDTIVSGVGLGKTSSIVVVAEGDEEGGALELAHKVSELGAVECRATILGHTQRGGRPTAQDRILASQLGAAGVEALLAGDSDKMVGRICDRIVRTLLPDTWEKKKPFDQKLYELAAALAS
jgi:6-phosphofructokinase 1